MQCCCGNRFWPLPTQLSCFPGTANAYTMRRTSDVVPVWFHMDLLSFVDSLQHHTKNASISGFAQCLQQRWLHQQLHMGKAQQHLAAGTGGQVPQEPVQLQLPISMYTLQEQLGAALREYQHATMTQNETAVERPAASWPLLDQLDEHGQGQKQQKRRRRSQSLVSQGDSEQQEEIQQQ